MYLVATFDANVAGADDWLAYSMIKSVELEIGGQRIDKQYGDWMYIWNELTLNYGKRQGYRTMVGASIGATDAATTLYVPIEFWFCRNPGLALPLIALQYHEVKVNLEFRTLAQLGAYAVSGEFIGPASVSLGYFSMGRLHFPRYR